MVFILIHDMQSTMYANGRIYHGANVIFTGWYVTQSHYQQYAIVLKHGMQGILILQCPPSIYHTSNNFDIYVPYQINQLGMKT